MGHSVSIMNDTGGSHVVRAAPICDTDIRTMARIYLDTHNVHGSDVSVHTLI